MANDAVLVTATNKQMAQQLVNMSLQARSLAINMQAFKAQLDHLTDGLTFITMETQCGIQAGSGSAVYNAINAINTLLGDANYKALCYQVQQTA